MNRATPESRLIDFIFEKHGGTIAVSKKVKASKQLVSIWKTKGFVPLNRLMKIAALLGVHPLALNYKQYRELIGSNLTFKEVKHLCYENLRDLLPS